MSGARVLRLAGRAALAWALLLFPCSAGGEEPAGTLLSDPFPEAAFHETGVDLLISWHRSGIRGAPLIRLASTDGFFPPSGATPDVKEIARLLGEEKYGELRRRSSPLPFAGNIMSPKNAVQAAWRLGIISEMIWVMPLATALTEDNFLRWKEIYRDSVDSAAGESLTFDDGVMRGTFGGMPVTIVDPGKLPSVKTGGALFAMDLSFLTTLKSNVPTLTPLKILSETTSLLQNAKIPLLGADVTQSFYGGDGPLFHIFLLDALLPVMKDPSLLGKPVDPLWLDISRAHEMERLSMRTAALDILSELTKSSSGYAYPWYFAAVLHFRRGWEESFRGLLREAYDRDPSYIKGYVEIAAMASGTGVPGFIRPLLEEAGRLAPGDPLVVYQLGNLNYSEGRCEEAAVYYERLMALLWPFEELRRLIEDCRPAAPGEGDGGASP